MQPQSHEIDEVGNAFISIAYPQYTPEQHEFLNQFLKRYAQDLDVTTLEKLFAQETEIINAIKSLHTFARQYKDEIEVFTEFKEEIEDLLITLNETGDGLII